MGDFFERKCKDLLTIHINGQFVSKSSKNVFPTGSANTAELQFIFDESWLGYAKSKNLLPMQSFGSTTPLRHTPTK